MRSSVRQMTVMIILMVLLAPGLLHARTSSSIRHPESVKVGMVPELGVIGHLASVWNLLTNLTKTGSTLDPSGGATSTTTTTTTNSDTGSTLDPSGTP